MGIVFKLNDVQKRVVYCAVVIMLLMGIFPPWKVSLPVTDQVYRVQHLGYSFIGNPPSAEAGYYKYGGCVDFSILMLQWLLVVALFVGIVCAIKDSDIF